METSIVIVDQLLDAVWADRALGILKMGEIEGQFYTPPVLLTIGQPRALFALDPDQTPPQDPVGVMTYAEFDQGEYHRIFRMDLLSVMPSHRRRGIARALLSKAHSLAVSRGSTEIDALVSTFNLPMMEFLREEGFGREVVRVSRLIVENRAPNDFEF